MEQPGCEPPLVICDAGHAVEAAEEKNGGRAGLKDVTQASSFRNRSSEESSTIIVMTAKSLWGEPYNSTEGVCWVDSGLVAIE